MTDKLQEKLLRATAAYVPRYVVQQVLDDLTAPLTGRTDRLTAAVLFADVSGFTLMSESLARLGKEGAEELTRVLNGYFTTMIDLVHSYGGVVIKFGGDAMTVMFADAPPQTDFLPWARHPRTSRKKPVSALVETACVCGLAMQECMKDFDAVQTAGGEFTLRMKIGISAGEVLFLNVGDAIRGLEYVLAGRALDRMAEAEHHAHAGEVVVDTLCAPEVAGITWGETRDDFRVVRALEPRFLPENGVLEREVPRDKLIGLAAGQRAALLEKLVPFIPPTIYQRLRSGQLEFVGEHRRVTSLFVKFTGLDYEADPAANTKLQRYFTTMQRIINRYEGRLNRVITGDKGNLLHVIFGAPVKHEDDEQRAVRCALNMQQQIKERVDLAFITGQKIGVASGNVFAGNVGGARRCEYTVMGDVVNLSARLMQAAPPHEIMLDPYTTERVKHEFVCEELAPITVKGKSAPIAVCLAKDIKAAEKSWGLDTLQQRRATPLVGRAAEVAQISQILEQVAAERGQLLSIRGEAGVGKSRLLAELVALGRARRWRTWGGNCFSYGTQSPYLPWIDFFHAFFNWHTGDTETAAERSTKIADRLAAVDPELTVWTPIIGQMLGLPLADNELTAALDAQLRKQRVFDLTLTLLRDQARRAPFILVFEDVHWVDSISLEMLNHVARNIADYPLLLVAVYRPTIELAEWRRYDYYHEIQLVDLPAADAVELVRYRLGGGEVPAVLRDRILRGEERVNPFFVEETVNALIDTGYLVPRPDGAGYLPQGDWTKIELPDTVQSLVMSRIDRLDESSKLAVKVAAVLGRVFKYAVLRAVYPVETTAEQLHKNLEGLSDLDLTPLDRPAPDWEYIFKHIITQEVAYESLLYAQRRDLHHRVGAYFERTYQDNLEEHYEALARHYALSGDAEKGFIYAIKAGGKAKSQFANAEAIEYYTRALQTDVTEERKIAVQESLGDVYQLIGKYAEATQYYQYAIDLEVLAAPRLAELKRKIAETYRLRGQFDDALHYLKLAENTLSGAQPHAEGEDRIVSATMARLHNSTAWVYSLRGEYDNALAHCRRGLNIAQALASAPVAEGHDAAIEIELELTMGSIYWRKGEYPQAIKYLQQCAERQERAGDILGMSRTFNNLSGVYWNQHDFNTATEYVKKSLKLSQKIGNTYGIAMCYNNLGVICYHAEQDYLKAISCYEKSLQIRQEIGDLSGIADTYHNLGEAYQALGDYQQAIEWQQKAITSYEELGHSPYVGTVQRMLGRTYQLAGQAAAAEEHIRASIATFTDIEDDLELARSYYALSELLGTDNPEGDAARQQAIALFEKAGATAELEKLESRN